MWMPASRTMKGLTGPKREDLTRGLTKQHKEEQNNFKSSSNIMRMIKSLMVRFDVQEITWKN
jgi:hypothetical protein